MARPLNSSYEHAVDQVQLARYAAIDIGTVTCRLLVGETDGRSVRPLARRAIITNLGEDVDATGVLKLEAMERVFCAVRGFLDIIAHYENASSTGESSNSVYAADENAGAAAESTSAAAGNENATDATAGGMRIIAMATSAARDAHNADEFAAGLAEMGVTLSVIPGEKEAALSFMGASMDFAGQPIIVTDIGGGSTEIIAGIAGQKPDFARSFNIGCRRMTERFLTCDPLDSAQVQESRQWVRDAFEPYFQNMQQQGFRAAHVVSVAGTATSIVSMIERMEVYDSERVHGYTVTKQQLDQVFSELSVKTLDQRMHRVGLQPERASVINAGLIIQQEVLRAAGANAFVASESDILQGIILTATREDAAAKKTTLLP